MKADPNERGPDAPQGPAAVQEPAAAAVEHKVEIQPTPGWGGTQDDVLVDGTRYGIIPRHTRRFDDMDWVLPPNDAQREAVKAALAAA